MCLRELHKVKASTWDILPTFHLHETRIQIFNFSKKTKYHASPALRNIY